MRTQQPPYEDLERIIDGLDRASPYLSVDRIPEIVAFADNEVDLGPAV